MLQRNTKQKSKIHYMSIPEIMSKDGKRHFINPEPDASINESKIFT